MPLPPPPLRQRLSQPSLRALRNSASNAMKPRRLSTGTPLLRETPFLHRRPLFPLSPRTSRPYSSGAGSGGQDAGGHPGGHRQRRRSRFSQRLREALSKTKIEWYPIPIGLGIGYLAFNHFRKIASKKYDDDGVNEGVENVERRKRIRPDGPWHVQVLSTLPLKAVSRAWGWFNELELPIFLRSPGFKLYAWAFGVNLSEVSEPDLRTYRNLSEFFYRELKPGSRPIDMDPAVMVSPADGRIIHFGVVRPGGHVEQVKGMTYSLDALIGSKTSDEHAARHEFHPTSADSDPREGGVVHPDEEFAIVNGISYTLPSLLLAGDDDKKHTATTEQEVREKISKPAEPEPIDQSLPASEQPSTLEVTSVMSEVTKDAWYNPAALSNEKQMLFCVIYLAPGDYHRFHSPVDWVVERRRHFAGELYSVSPYLQRTLPGLFTINERVALLGRWRHGLFTMTPVGATNVGSIIVNFDKELRTNKPGREARKMGEPVKGGYFEAVYRNASWLLGGQPVKKGAEIGGFRLGSTIVLVFEAPGEEVGGRSWKWLCERGAKVKVGEALGKVEGM
ncbi:phosphatidylserine decarboxylase-domain-containing protein [Peziza echinospora]|nr:phosphatidylserine decarboxylase-domain-containing protein [Peziza echinospora]